jgi:hypothetical protein
MGSDLLEPVFALALLKGFFAWAGRSCLKLLTGRLGLIFNKLD